MAEIATNRHVVIAPGTPGLVAAYRFEEGAGTVVGDSSTAGSPDGELVAGVAGNGEWVAFADDPANTAPIGDAVIFADGFESGDTTSWSATATP